MWPPGDPHWQRNPGPKYTCPARTVISQGWFSACNANQLSGVVEKVAEEPWPCAADMELLNCAPTVGATVAHQLQCLVPYPCVHPYPC